MTDPSLLATYEALLAPEERERRARCYFDKHRHEYLLTRALCRGVLSRYASVAPRAWAFTANRYGRPEIASSAGCPLRFNLTNLRAFRRMAERVGKQSEVLRQGADGGGVIPERRTP